MARLHIAFGEVPVGARFETSGCAWLKVSTRTARVNGNGQVFYFSKHETVRIDKGELEHD